MNAEKLNAVWTYLLSQLGESSTVRGIIVLATMAGGWAAKIEVDTILPIAVSVGAVLKILLPDRIIK